MKLMVNHQTHYNYTETAKNSIQYIKMLPQTSLHQHVMNWAISVPGDKTLKRDIFNNIWITASQRYEYQHLTFMAQGIVELLNTEIGGVDVSIPINLFLQSTEPLNMMLKCWICPENCNCQRSTTYCFAQ